MEKSLFIQFVDKYFKAVIGKITERFNGKAAEETLMHKTMLTEEYSADLTWGSTEINHSIVAADVVALDSSLPLKQRATITIASGKLPKLGMKYRKGEKEISDINVMIARGTDQQTIATKVFDDAAKVVKAIDIRTEILFQQALSTGYALATDDDNVGTGVRINFGYKEANTFHATTAKWGASGYTPQDDVQQLFDKASEDGSSIGHVYMSKKYFDFFRKSDQGKLLAASYNGNVVTNVSILPVPARANFLDALADEFGATFHYVDSSFIVEGVDGTKKTIKPWEEANIVGVPSNVVGRLVYGTLAEETNPVASVSYMKSGSHILVSKYSKTDPLEEFTASQAVCLPVIDGGSNIYVLHADATASGITLEKSSTTFTSAAATETIGIHYDGDIENLSVTGGSTSTISGKISNGKLVITAKANSSGSSRSANIVVSDGTNSATIACTQSA